MIAALVLLTLIPQTIGKRRKNGKFDSGVLLVLVLLILSREELTVYPILYRNVFMGEGYSLCE